LKKKILHWKRKLKISSYKFTNKYLIIYLPLVDKNLKHYKTNVTDFISNYVKINGDENNTVFTVVSAIKFISMNRKNYLNGGHYIMYKRLNNVWQMINSEKVEYTENFSKSLDSIYLIFLKKQ
jgi:ubiquitin C-terminal hydrolase